MEQNMIELFKELIAKSEELGRLRAEAEFKDRVIAGLTAQFSTNPLFVQPVTSTESHVSELSTVQNDVEVCPVEDFKVVEEETTKEPVVEKKKGRPKGSKTLKKSLSTVEPKKTMSGGSVFKDFVPLNVNNLIETNSNAYIPAEKKPTFVL